MNNSPASTTTAASTSHSFAASLSSIASYDFSIKPTMWSEGTGIEMSENGRVTGAIYASGAIVKRQGRQMLARAEDGTIWFGDRDGMFHPID